MRRHEILERIEHLIALRTRRSPKEPLQLFHDGADTQRMKLALKEDITFDIDDSGIDIKMAQIGFPGFDALS